MQTTRRVFLHRLMQFAVAVVGLFSPLHGRAQNWRIRRARATDAADLVAIFNAHRRAGICPYADEIATWTVDQARAFLEIYNGALLVERDGLPVGFAGLIDCSNPTTASAILPDAEPELTVVALRFGKLARPEVLPAVKHLAAAMGRELQRLGFHRCRMRILAQPLFESNDWYSRHMTVLRVRQRDGIDHALEVSIDVSGCVAELAREGLTSVPPNDSEEKDIAVGDFDNDGDDDIIVGRKLPFSNSGPRAPLLLLNNDGILTDATASKFVNPSTGAPVAPAPTDARDVFVGDLDGGGRGDLVFANTCEQNPTLYRNQEGRCVNWQRFALRNDWLPPAFSVGPLRHGPEFSREHLGLRIHRPQR